MRHFTPRRQRRAAATPSASAAAAADAAAIVVAFDYAAVDCFAGFTTPLQRRCAFASTPPRQFLLRR